MDAVDLIAAIVAIAKDPKAWEKRVAEAREAAGNLAEARKLRDEANEARKTAASDLETARYERAQSERNVATAGAQSTANALRERELRGKETELTAARQKFETDAAAMKVNYEQREAELGRRERVVAQKLAESSKLMAAYDEAKHKAALKLAS
jgi:hypothetical protein